MITIYARCSALERLELQEYFEEIVGNMQKPWLVEGDLNTVCSELEKLGELRLT